MRTSFEKPLVRDIATGSYRVPEQPLIPGDHRADTSLNQTVHDSPTLQRPWTG